MTKKTIILQDLVNQYGADSIIIADKGNRSAFGEKGTAMLYAIDVARAYGGLQMKELDSPHLSSDGYECSYASDWIVEGKGDNPWSVRIFL